MSLIVDINPVPWEILEQVKARLLRNRAKKQKRQPEKGKDLRRVMQVDNGILAKQRWEEPSFIGGGDDTPFILITKQFLPQNFAFNLFIDDVFVAEIDFTETNISKSYIILWAQDDDVVAVVKSIHGDTAGWIYFPFTNNQVLVTVDRVYVIIILSQNAPTYNSLIKLKTEVTYTTWALDLQGAIESIAPNNLSIRGGFVRESALPFQPSIPPTSDSFAIGNFERVSPNLYYDYNFWWVGIGIYGIGDTETWSFMFPDG